MRYGERFRLPNGRGERTWKRSAWKRSAWKRSAGHLRTTVQPYRLEEANQVLVDLKESRIDGTAVLTVSGS